MADAPNEAGPPPDIIAQAIAISSLIHSISNKMTATGTTTYGQFDVGFLDARVLYVLSKDPPMPASRLAERLGVDPAAISRAVSRLAGGQLLDKGAPRRRALSLTQSGEALARAIAKVFEDRCFRLVSEMPAEDLQRLHALLEHLQRNMGRMAILADELRLEKCGTNFDQP